ncbi:MAG: universal stress protein [Actinomycetota bacterium]|nr:universal stress protein [Actinomycetota bacterium]
MEEATSRDVPLRLICAIEPRNRLNSEQSALDLAAAETAARNVVEVVESLEHPVKVEVAIIHDRADLALIAASRSAIMVCVGALGRDYAAGLRLGSVAATLSRSAHCPVAIVRHHEPGLAKTGNVVADIRGTGDSDWILECAVAEAHLRRVPLTVLATWHPRYIDVHDSRAVEDNNRLTRAQTQKRLARWRRVFPDVDIEVVPLCGSPLNYLAKHSHDVQLLVVGQDRENGLDEVVRVAVHNTEWSVLVCQPRQPL